MCRQCEWGGCQGELGDEGQGFFKLRWSGRRMIHGAGVSRWPRARGRLASRRAPDGAAPAQVVGLHYTDGTHAALDEPAR